MRKIPSLLITPFRGGIRTITSLTRRVEKLNSYFYCTKLSPNERKEKVENSRQNISFNNKEERFHTTLIIDKLAFIRFTGVDEDDSSFITFNQLDMRIRFSHTRYLMNDASSSIIQRFSHRPMKIAKQNVLK